MNSKLALLLLLVSTSAFATDLRSPRNRSSGGKQCSQVSVSGTMTDSICMSGTDASVTIGPSTGAVVDTVEGALQFGVGSNTGTPSYGLRRNGSNALEFFSNSNSGGYMDSSQNWFMGSSSRQTKVSTAQGNAAALFGNPVAQYLSAGYGNPQSVSLGSPNSAALCVATTGVASQSVTFMAGPSNTVAIISQIGSFFVVGTPGSSQMGITYANAAATVTFTAGSGAGSNISLACIGTQL